MSEARSLYENRRPLPEFRKDCFRSCRKMQKHNNYTMFTFTDNSIIKIMWDKVQVTDEDGTRNYTYEDYSLPDT